MSALQIIEGIFLKYEFVYRPADVNVSNLNVLPSKLKEKQ